MEQQKKADNAIIYRGGKLLWGKPPQIVAAVLDKKCPRCGKSTRADMGLDLGYDHGKIFGGVCFSCGWTF